MAVRARIEPIDRDIQAIIDTELSPAAQSRALAVFAAKQLADAQKTNTAALGYLPQHKTFVDGTEGRPLADVKPDGRVVFVFDLVDDALTWIGEQLVKHSPVLTGEYAASHTLLADGVEVSPGEPLPAAQEYIYLSSVPYARKIERGLSRQAPEGVYEAVAVLAAQRFGNVASIRFSYRSMLLPYIAGSANRAERAAMRAQPARIAAMAMERATRQPAIIVRTGGRR
ncbi:hypothetical protein [Ancylobacter defluvii]|uniref:Uncharacterized protein n=1 Tax=Ancylobacter defluvii TaxID=1282440 RepID=A0A9W6JZD7_9HYPH|nr:hypothetical protein [Ancylobacter defluvii]MBS7588289.1 hypothetical protein [Ancylobacter defluvii]GLK86685.1 hypothetical protein GCM10017653_47550 [Ancylobacter defluvii]